MSTGDLWFISPRRSVVGFAERIQPTEEATSRQVGLVAPVADEVNDGVSSVVGDPTAL